MAYEVNPLIKEDLQHKQEFNLFITDESGEKIDIIDAVERLQTAINSKVDIDFGPKGRNRILITDNDGKVTIIEGVVMSMQEREKLSSLANSMLLKGVKSSLAEIETTPNPQNGWVFLLPSGDTFLQYCYCDNRWQLIGTTAMQGKYLERTGPVVKTVGGISQGTQIYGKTYDQIFTEMFFPYVAPSNFSIVPGGSPYNLTSILEKGTKVIINSLTPSATQGSKAITSFKVFKDAAYSQLVAQSEAISQITFDALVQNSIYATISDGQTTLKKSWSANFVDPTFYGVLNKKTQPLASEITAFPKNLLTKAKRTFTYSASDEFPFVAYPKEYGKITSVIDSNGYELINDFKRFEFDITFSNRTSSYFVYLKQIAVINNKFDYTFIF